MEQNIIGLILLGVSLLGVMVLAPFDEILIAIIFFLMFTGLMIGLIWYWLSRRAKTLGHLPKNWVFESGCISILSLAGLFLVNILN